MATHTPRPPRSAGTNREHGFDEEGRLRFIGHLLPMRPGQVERRTRDYKGHGTKSLFAALDVKTGTVLGELHRRHRSAEFRQFLDTIDMAVPPSLEYILYWIITAQTRPP